VHYLRGLVSVAYFVEFFSIIRTLAMTSGFRPFPHVRRPLASVTTTCPRIEQQNEQRIVEEMLRLAHTPAR
jgi:hypothetical protein